MESGHVSQAGSLCAAIILISFEPPAEAHDIYSHLKDRLGNSCCNEQDCRPAPYRVTPTGVHMLVNGTWITVPDYRVQYRALPGARGKQPVDIGAGTPATWSATGWTTQPTAQSCRPTLQRSLVPLLRLGKVPSNLFPNAPYRKFAAEYGEGRGEEGSRGLARGERRAASGVQAPCSTITGVDRAPGAGQRQR
jgi:hypothetical protein